MDLEQGFKTAPPVGENPGVCSDWWIAGGIDSERTGHPPAADALDPVSAPDARAQGTPTPAGRRYPLDSGNADFADR